jgi:hypothetical protein
LGIIPAYASSLDNVKTTGDFVMGFAKAYIQIQRFRNLILKSHPITLLKYLTPKTVEILLLTLKSSMKQGSLMIRM